MLLSDLEKDLRKKGFNLVAGVDEAGRGPLAGPVFAAAVILPRNPKIKGLDDSKKLSPRARDAVFDRIMQKAVCIGVGSCSEHEIDSINILQATFCAMADAVRGLSSEPDIVLVDGNKKIPDVATLQKTVVGGDAKCACIAAASVIAKVLRDRHMRKLHCSYPQYGFDRHKGYGTRAHFAAIALSGACPAHRKSFLKNILHRQTISDSMITR